MRRNLRCHCGQSLVEFALVLPLLLVLTFGIIEFGIMLFNQQILTNASREGARAGIVSQTPRVPYASIDSVVQNYCAAHLITFGTRNPPQTIVSPTPYNPSALFGSDLTVQVSYQYSFLIIPSFILGTSGSMQAVTVMKYE